MLKELVVAPLQVVLSGELAACDVVEIVAGGGGCPGERVTGGTHGAHLATFTAVTVPRRLVERSLILVDRWCLKFADVTSADVTKRDRVLFNTIRLLYIQTEGNIQEAYICSTVVPLLVATLNRGRPL